MKKSIFTLGLLTISVLCLTACGDKKDFNMSFEDALELASHSAVQDVMANANNAEQSFNIAWNYDKDGTKVDAKLTSKSKQNLKDTQSESNIAIDLKVQEEENNLDLKWNLDIKFVPSAIYLNLNSLDVKSSDSPEWIGDLSWFLNQWFSIPLNDALDINSLNMKQQFELSSKIKDVVNNEGLQVYNGKFTDYNWYNARKISIDDQKLIKILKDYYNSTTNDIENETPSANEENIDSNGAPEENAEATVEENVEATTEENVEANVENNPEADTNTENNENETAIEDIDLDSVNLKIENFEWYLVIIWNDKVALAIENMDIVENGSTTNLNGIFSDKDIILNVFSEWEEIITLSAKKKGSHFNTTLNLSGLCLIEGSIAPKVSSSKIDINFDLSLNIKSNSGNTIVPLKGSWSYAPISEYKVEIPSEAQDLSQVLWGLLWWLYWWNDMYYNDYYEDYELDAENAYNENLNLQEISNEEIPENTTTAE